MINKAWIRSDICWCMDSAECEHIKCFRHISNLPKEVIQYTAASLKETDSCPYAEDFISERLSKQYGKQTANKNNQKESARGTV